MAAPSRQTRKSLSAIPTPLPSTATASSSNIAGPGSGKAKAGKRPASFAPGDKVGFGSRPVAIFGKREEAGTAGGGSNQQKKVARPAAVSLTFLLSCLTFEREGRAQPSGTIPCPSSLSLMSSDGSGCEQ